MVIEGGHSLLPTLATVVKAASLPRTSHPIHSNNRRLDNILLAGVVLAFRDIFSLIMGKEQV
jgi:hypothetical protein